MPEKICAKCKVTYPLSKFGKNAKSKDGLSPKCKPCKSLANRLFRLNNGIGGVMKDG